MHLGTKCGTHEKDNAIPTKTHFVKLQNHMQEGQEAINFDEGPWINQFCLWYSNKKEKKTLKFHKPCIERHQFPSSSQPKRKNMDMRKMSPTPEAGSKTRKIMNKL